MIDGIIFDFETEPPSLLKTLRGYERPALGRELNDMLARLDVSAFEGFVHTSFLETLLVARDFSRLMNALVR